MMMPAFFAVSSFRPSGSNNIPHPFTTQCGSGGTICPSMFQYEVLPLFYYRRCTVPVKGMLEQNNIMLQKQRLFVPDIYIEVRIYFIEIVKSNAL